MTVYEEKVAQMVALAKECGFVCEALSKYRHEFLLAISGHLVHRSGANIYQSAGFSIPLFPMTAAKEIFGEANVQTETASCITYNITSMDNLVTFFGGMLSEAGKLSAGIARALKSESEPFARVLAMLIPPFQLSVTEMARGVSRAYINLMYILVDEHAEIHYPKDNSRREISFSHQEELRFRQQILLEARKLVHQGAPLSSGWLNRLGMPQHALAVQAAEQAGQKLTLPRAPCEKRKHNHWNVQMIVEERPSSGRALAWYLVRWEGCAAALPPSASLAPSPPRLPPRRALHPLSCCER